MPTRASQVFARSVARLTHLANCSLRIVITLSQALALGVTANFAASSPAQAYAAPLVLAPQVTAPLAAPAIAPAAAGDITGVVFNDYNDDGFRNVDFSPDFPAVDVGVPDIPVAAYSAAGFVVSTTTGADGTYILTTGLPPGTPVRIEFTGFKELDYESSVNGPDSNSSVRFTTTTDDVVTGINFGVLNTLDYCQNNPRIAVNRFIFSDNQKGPFRNQPTCYTLPYAAVGKSDPNLVTQTLAFQTGAIYGMGYQKGSRSIFLSAYLKRGTSFGPGIAGDPNSDGTGTIYKLDRATNVVAPFIDLDAVFGRDVTGADPHLLSDFDPFNGNKSFDKFAYALPGKMSLGDIDVDENDQTLWAVNMYDRSLYKLPISTTAIAPTASQITTYTIPSPNCINGQGRPFGIKPHKGKIYVGGVCTAEQITSTAGITYFAGVTQVNGVQVDLRAYVYAFDVASSSWSAAPVLEFPLNYRHGCADIFPDYRDECRTGVRGSVADWRPWQDSFQGLINDKFPAGYALADVAGVTDTFTAYPQPMLADIEILTNGDMVVGLRDRFSDQIGYLDPGPEEQKPFGADVIAVAAGDVLRASPNGAGGWTIENNSGSVPAGRFGPTFQGQNNGQGPGGGEFYSGDANGPFTHDESTYGSLAQMPGVPEIVNGAADPLSAFSAGLFWLSHDDGTQNRAFQLYNNQAPGSFAKANGLGDLEILCDGAPIEIGNRVWVDVDFDGIQDAEEPPIAGINLVLSDDSGPIATVTTDDNGNYYFSNAITPTYPAAPSRARFSTNSVRAVNAVNASSLYGLPIAYNRTYTVSVDMSQPPLALYQLTSPNKADTTADGDIRDSDGVLSGGIAYVTFHTGVPRQNNHSFDFGFNNSVSLGNQVWFDVNNNGTFDAGESGVSNATVQLFNDSNGSGAYDAGDQLVASTLTVNGIYNFTNLSPTHSISTSYLVVLPGANFCPGGVLLHYQNSTGNVGGNSDLNLRDHGIDPNLPLDCGNGEVIASEPVSLTVGGEPINDGDADANSNLTLDFGFYKLELGNQVWYDQDNSGNLNGAEVGLPNVPVRLLDVDNQVLSSTLTDANGFYTFTNLSADNYCAEITPPPGYFSSTGPNESATPDNNIDSDDNGTLNQPGGIVRSNCLLLEPGAEPIVITATGTSQNPTLDFGLQARAGLGNYVWYDWNQDGIQDINEPPTPGVTVTLFTTANVALSTTTTNLAGFYIFTDLIPSSYSVCFDAPVGYTFTTPLVGLVITSDLDSNANPISNNGVAGRACSLAVTLQPNEFNPTLDAGLVTPTLLAGLGNYVWYDLNKNGAQDIGEPPTPGVAVTLYGSANLPISQTLTDLAGGYIFTGLIPSRYSVCFDAPVGYTFTVWMSGTTMASDLDSNANPISNAGVPGRACSPPVTLQPGEFNPTLDAGLVTPTVPAGLGNYVWYDLNKNGAQDNGEPPTPGVTVTLYTNANLPSQAISQTLTDLAGGYIFTALVPGDYYVCFDVPAGYTFTAWMSGTNMSSDLDSNANPINNAGVPGRACSPPVTLQPGEFNPTLDAGLVAIVLPAGLGNYVWYDINKNGAQDNGAFALEPPTASITVTLYDSANQPISQTLTDIAGGYIFTALVPGDYSVCFDVPAGYTFTAWMSGTTMASDLDSNANPISNAGVPGRACSLPVTLQPGEFNPTLDAGLVAIVPPAGLGNYVWYDINKNGAQDNGEPPTAGVTVTLYDTTNLPISQTLTNIAGGYIFTSLVPAAYYVCFDVPTGYTFTAWMSGTTMASDLDSNANPSGNAGVPGRACSPAVTLQPGGFNPTLDAGLVTPTLPAGLGNYVWLDLNKDGLQGGNEPPVPGITVTLYNSVSVAISTTTTGPAGTYVFTGLVPSTYSVCFSAPAGYTFTTPMAGSVITSDLDSNADRSTGCTMMVALQPGEFNPTLDAGLVQILSGLGNYVWLDLNKDGLQGGNEPPVPGVTVTLYNSVSVAISTTTTGPAGTYVFTGLVPSTYYVCFTTPAGYTFTTPMVGSVITSDLDSNADRSTGCTMGVTLRPGEYNSTLDAGLVTPTLPAGLGNYVWYDLNKNGLQDSTEPAAPSVTVTLYGSANLPISQTLTNIAGGYIFTSLIPGDYSVCFDVPAGYTFTTWMSGTNMSSDLDSNANPVLMGPISSTGVLGRACSPPVTLQPGEFNPTLDAGLVQILSGLGNYVWLDLNKDGLQGGNEPPVPGVTVTLYNSVSVAISTTTTGPAGTYVFTGLVPSTYYVCFTTPAGYTFTTPMVGSVITSDLDSNADRSTGCTMGVTLRPGEYNSTLDAGLVTPTLLAGLGNYMWVDADKNGLQDAGELPVKGMTVTLFGSANLPISRTTTDAAGSYIFTGLIPSAYYVCFASPVAFTFTYWMSNTTMASDLDSNANPNDSHGTPNLGCSMPVTLQPGEFNPTLDAGIYAFNVNAVALVGFGAQKAGGFVEVNWTTGAEINSFGFALYRSADGNRATAEQITEEMIAAVGPSTYRFVDRTADPAQHYTYWVVEMESSGKLNEYAPTAYAPAAAPIEVAPVAAANAGGLVIPPIVAPALSQGNSSAPLVLDPASEAQRPIEVQAAPVQAVPQSTARVPQSSAAASSTRPQPASQPAATAQTQPAKPTAASSTAPQQAASQTQATAVLQPATRNQPQAAVVSQPETNLQTAMANPQSTPATSRIWVAAQWALIGLVVIGVLLGLGLLMWAFIRRR